MPLSLPICKIEPNHSASMNQDFMDNLILADRVENLLGWITLAYTPKTPSTPQIITH